MSCDLVSFTVQLLNGRVVGVLVRDEESGLDRTTVRIVATFFENSIVDVDVVIVDRVVERDHHHLRNIRRFEFARNLSSVRRTETVGKHTLTLIARWRSVWIFVNRTRILIRSIFAVGCSVAEQFLVDTVSVSARQFAGLTDWFIGGQQRGH